MDAKAQQTGKVGFFYLFKAKVECDREKEVEEKDNIKR